MLRNFAVYAEEATGQWEVDLPQAAESSAASLQTETSSWDPSHLSGWIWLAILRMLEKDRLKQVGSQDRKQPGLHKWSKSNLF